MESGEGKLGTAIEAKEARKQLKDVLIVDTAGRLTIERIAFSPLDVVADVADAFGLSQRALQRLVVDRVGLTPKWLIQRRRLHDAVSGLKSGTTSLADLAQSSRVTTVLCAPQVPCGAAAVRVEQAGGVSITPVSEEQSAAAVLGKVTAAEADAGIVYVTDARQAGPRVAEVPIPPEVNATNTYPIVILKESPQPALAEEFIALVRGPQGQDVLRRAGFGPA